MTHLNKYTFTRELAERGLDAIRELLRVLINNNMQVERSKYRQERNNERTEDRMNYRNGYRDRTWKTRVSENDLRIPKLSVVTYFPSLFKPRRCAGKALLAVVQQTYVEEVSTC